MLRWFVYGLLVCSLIALSLCWLVVGVVALVFVWHCCIVDWCLFVFVGFLELCIATLLD